MQPFELITVSSVPEAVKAHSASSTAQTGASIRIIAGGTNLVDYMKLNVETPRQLIDINSLPLDKIEQLSAGGLKIGALARNSDVAQHEIGESAISCAFPSSAERRLNATSQHGDHGWKSVAENALRLLS